jgi:DNA-binding GntR family transcriptional regulator
MDGMPVEPLRRALPLRDRIHEHMRAAILSGELAAGTPVVEADLALRFGASRTPVREALRRLESEGLLQPRGQRGSVVRALDPDEVDCVFEIREALESLAARRAARSISAAALDELRAHVAGMRAALDDPHAMERSDTAFHDTILASAGGERLRKMLGDVHEELILNRLLSLTATDRRRETIAEHEAILVALAAHDEEAAARLSAAHIAAARAAVHDVSRRRSAP